MINRQRWCDKCGGFVEGIYAGNPMFCRCDPKADRIKDLEAEVERLKEIKMNQASLIAAVNYCLSEFPSDRSSVYLAPIMENLFQK
jgi:hypothetical protein